MKELCGELVGVCVPVLVADTEGVVELVCIEVWDTDAVPVLPCVDVTDRVYV